MAIIAIALVTISIGLASPVADISDVKNLISSLEKPAMSSQEMAAFLMAQGFNAIAKNGYTELGLTGKIFKITPSAEKPGSYEMELIIQQCPNTKMYEEDRITLKS